jgi:hypothetical protein
MGNVALPTTLWQDSCRERPFRAWKVHVRCRRRRLGFTLSLAQMERELLGGAHPGRTGRGEKTGSSGRKKAVDDQQQDPIGQNAFRQWRATSQTRFHIGPFCPR